LLVACLGVGASEADFEVEAVGVGDILAQDTVFVRRVAGRVACIGRCMSADRTVIYARPIKGQAAIDCGRQHDA
jgi:hypothetical protein